MTSWIWPLCCSPGPVLIQAPSCPPRRTVQLLPSNRETGALRLREPPAFPMIPLSSPVSHRLPACAHLSSSCASPSAQSPPSAGFSGRLPPPRAEVRWMPAFQFWSMHSALAKPRRRGDTAFAGDGFPRIDFSDAPRPKSHCFAVSPPSTGLPAFFQALNPSLSTRISLNPTAASACAARCARPPSAQ